jgi:hypothetical protein
MIVFMMHRSKNESAIGRAISGSYPISNILLQNWIWPWLGKKEKAFYNRKANKIALSPRNKHLTLSFICMITLLMVVLEIDPLLSLKTSLPTGWKNGFLYLSISPFFYSLYLMLTVNHHHTFSLSKAVHSRLYGSKSRRERERENDKGQKSFLYSDRYQIYYSSPFSLPVSIH